MRFMRVSVVIPAYNEEGNIKRLLKDIFLIFKKNRYKGEIIVVDDGSDDDTFSICDDLRNQIPNLRVVKHTKRQGKSGAIQSGVKMAKNEFIIMIDADYQYDPRDIPQIIKKFEEGYEFVTGRRVKRKDSIPRLFLSSLFNTINRILFGIKVHDINCGLKGFSKSLFKRVKLEFPKWFMDTELIAKLYAARIPVAEVAITHHPREYGHSKISCIGTTLETLVNSLKLKISLLKNQS